MSKVNRTIGLAKNTLIFGIGSIGSKLFQFIAIPVFTYFLTTKEYGQADLLTTIVGLLIPVFSLCIYDAILRFIIEDKKQHVMYFSNALFIVFISTIILCVAAIGSALITRKILYSLFFLLLALQIISSTLSQYAKAMNRNIGYSLNGIVLSILIIMFSYFEFQTQNNMLNAYFLGQVLAYIVSIFFLIFVLRKDLSIDIKTISLESSHKLLKYSLPLIPNQIMWWVMNVSDRLFVTVYLGLKVNGIYAIASKIPALVNIIITIFMQSWQLSSFENANSKDRDEYFSSVFNNLCFYLILFTLLVLTFTKIIIKIIAAPAYYTAWKYVPLLLFSLFFSNISMFLGTNYLVGKRTGGIFKTSVYGALINTGLNFILIPIFGVNGATLTTLISYAVVCLVRYKDTSKYIHIRIDKRLLGMAVIILFIQTILLYSNFNGALITNTFLSLLFIWIEKKYLYNLLNFTKKLILKG